MSKTKEEVDKLKKDWMNDPCWGIEGTEGFEEYREELIAFSNEYKTRCIIEWKKRKSIHFNVAKVFADSASKNQYNGLTKHELYTAFSIIAVSIDYSSSEAIAKKAISVADAILNLFELEP